MSGYTCPVCGFNTPHPDAVLAGWCALCHAHTGPADVARLRFRLFIDRELVAEQWVHLDDPDFENAARAVGDQQNLLAAAAEQAGRLWLVEVFDPARPPQCAYARLGTDAGAMYLPIQITREDRS